MSIPVTGDSFYRPGPCLDYEPVFTFCPLPAGSELVSGAALQAASELLYYATAQRFDSCQVTLRPCRRDCFSGSSGFAGWWNGTWPQPYKINGQWYNLTCGSCGDGCSCTEISETVLPGPVQSIVQVTVNGVILTPDVDYRLDDYRKLVRLGDVWPLCNDYNRDISQTDTWSVTAVYGEPLPMLGRLAAGQLTTEITKDLLCGSCNLPPGVTNITRQGVSMTLEDAQQLVDTDLFGLRYVDRFIRTYNPHHLMARAQVYDLDGSGGRVTGTSI
jgi:hypothetical protein